ncbi:hypothetical protein FHU30_002740 [Actinomadura rupiterrae]|nr:hypothetical protein [Actinomadura rupiterrae]
MCRYAPNEQIVTYCDQLLSQCSIAPSPANCRSLGATEPQPTHSFSPLRSRPRDVARIAPQLPEAPAWAGVHVPSKRARSRRRFLK